MPTCDLGFIHESSAGTTPPSYSDAELREARELYGSRVRFPAQITTSSINTWSTSDTVTFNNAAFATWTADISTTSTDFIWVAWTNDSTGYTTTTGDATGTASNGAYTIRIEAWQDWAPKALTHAEKLKRRIEQRRSIQPVKKRAEELLKSILDDEQQEDWRLHNSVRVHGSDGGLYEIGCGWAGMVYTLDPVTEEPLQKLCVHPSSSYPVGDRVAALVLALQTDEMAILKKGNPHPWGVHEKERVKLRRAHRAAG